MIQKFIAVGSIFAVLAFIHMFADLFTQSQKVAMVKHEETHARAIHCLLYTACFAPVFLVLRLPLLETVAGLFFLFASHFIGDSYLPSFLWARYVRRPPEMEVDNKIQGFQAYAATPLGKGLVIWVDQIYHLACLWYVVALVVVGA